MPVLDLPNYYMASSMTSSSLSVMIATQTKLIFLPKEIKTYVIKAKLAGRIIVSSFCELQTVHGKCPHYIRWFCKPIYFVLFPNKYFFLLNLLLLFSVQLVG